MMMDTKAPKHLGARDGAEKRGLVAAERDAIEEVEPLCFAWQALARVCITLASVCLTLGPVCLSLARVCQSLASVCLTLAPPLHNHL